MHLIRTKAAYRRPLIQLSTLCLLCGGATAVQASPSISAGVWFNYTYQTDNDRDDETLGNVDYQALILYVNHNDDNDPWSFSGEMRFGKGSFTDINNNNTDDTFAIHKAAIQYQIDADSTLTIGKSAVPFGFATVNFWGGDLLMGGYGDQMDVGFKYSRQMESLRLDLAYFHADDWGQTSTDTTDDNAKWGSSTTFRKVQTLVANLDWALNDEHTLGLSLQRGGLQSLVSHNAVAVTGAPADDSIDGSHSAINLHWYGNFGDFYTKAQHTWVSREDIPGISSTNSYRQYDVENQRTGFTGGYRNGDWHYYLEVTTAKPDTKGNNADTVTAFVPGVVYDYGPGWMYFEYINMDGYIARDGTVGEGDFEAFFVTIDYYF